MTAEELAGYFTGIALPDKVQIDSGVVIEDVPLFIESHLNYIKANEGKKGTEVYYDRLNRLIAFMEANKEAEE
jgi:predicted Zn-dependent protease with MMP-like domain